MTIGNFVRGKISRKSELIANVRDVQLYDTWFTRAINKVARSATTTQLSFVLINIL